MSAKNKLAALSTSLLVLALPGMARAQAPTSPSFKIQSFEVEGNQLLSSDQIQARLGAFKGASSMAQLRDAAAAVQELYRRAGYGGVVAFLPEQTVSGDTVKIRVIEGKLSRIDVLDNQHFSRENILHSLPALRLGQTPDVRQIDAQIQMANENPAKQVQVLLQPGADPGSIAAKLSVAEGPLQRWHARLDNTGGERTGRWRAAAGWQHADVFGSDHVLSTEFQTSPEHPSAVKVLSAGYRIPLYAQAMAIDAFAAWSDVDGGTNQTAAGDLAFSGRGHVLGMRLSRYLQRRGNVDQRLQIGIEHRDYLNDCSIAGLPDGACGSAGASVTVRPLSMSYTLQSVGQFRFGINATLSHNFGWGGGHGSDADFNNVRNGAKARYTVLRLGGNLGFSFGDGASLELRASAQSSRSPLVSGEAFGIGGANSVRGFEERELNGDSGMQASLEVISPNLGERWLKQEALRLNLLSFIDAGWVRNEEGNPCLQDRSNCRMGSVGFGLRASHRQTQLRFDMARAMSTASQTRSGDWRAHLSLVQTF